MSTRGRMTSDKKREREARLAKALRENLKQRKAAAREVGKAEAPPPPASDGPALRAGED